MTTITTTTQKFFFTDAHLTALRMVAFVVLAKHKHVRSWDLIVYELFGR